MCSMAGHGGAEDTESGGDSVRSSHAHDAECGEGGYLDVWAKRRVEEVSTTKAFSSSRMALTIKLDHIVKSILGREARVEIFGSACCGLATKGSDVDLTVSMCGERLDKDAQAETLKRLSKAFRFQHGMNSYALLSARIPIIKLKDPATGISADVSIQNDMPVFRSQLLLQYTRIDERFRQLVLLVKDWSHARAINNAPHGFLNSFGYTMLVLFYLQNTSPPILPRLHDKVIALRGEALRHAREQGHPEEVELPVHPQGRADGVVIHHHLHDRLVGWGSDNASSLGDLLRGFFRFYAKDIDMRQVIMCVRSAPPPTRSEASPPVNQETHLWIVDPLDPSNNVARSVHAAGAGRIAEELLRGFTVLEAPGCDPSQLSAKAPGSGGGGDRRRKHRPKPSPGGCGAGGRDKGAGVGGAVGSLAVHRSALDALSSQEGGASSPVA